MIAGTSNNSIKIGLKTSFLDGFLSSSSKLAPDFMLARKLFCDLCRSPLVERLGVRKWWKFSSQIKVIIKICLGKSEIFDFIRHCSVDSEIKAPSEIVGNIFSESEQES